MRGVADNEVISVVVASHDASGVIADCLDALLNQTGGPSLEIIVADSSSDGTARLIRSTYPQVHLLHDEVSRSVAELRGIGIATATGAIIAILDPYSIAAPDWARSVAMAHARQPDPVIGGSVGLHEPCRRSLLEWALYFNEYGLFMPPVSCGPAGIVPGSNVSYKRDALFDGDRVRYPVFWKTFVNQGLERKGHRLWLDPNIRVNLHKPIPFMDFLTTRFLHGRCFAGMRTADCPAVERVLRAVTAPVLPFLQLARWTRGFWPKRSERLRYVLCTPLQLLLFAAWACGEFCGYLFGAGGTCRRLHY